MFFENEDFMSSHYVRPIFPGVLGLGMTDIQKKGASP